MHSIARQKSNILYVAPDCILGHSIPKIYLSLSVLQAVINASTTLILIKQQLISTKDVINYSIYQPLTNGPRQSRRRPMFQCTVLPSAKFNDTISVLLPIYAESFIIIAVMCFLYRCNGKKHCKIINRRSNKHKQPTTNMMPAIAGSDKKSQPYSTIVVICLILLCRSRIQAFHLSLWWMCSHSCLINRNSYASDNKRNNGNIKVFLQIIEQIQRTHFENFQKTPLQAVMHRFLPQWTWTLDNRVSS